MANKATYFLKYGNTLVTVSNSRKMSRNEIDKVVSVVPSEVGLFFHSFIHFQIKIINFFFKYITKIQ